MPGLLHTVYTNLVIRLFLKAGKTGLFYYRVVMEELSDRVVITVIDGIRYELETSSSHKQIIHDLVNHHREQFTVTLTALLQESLATALKNKSLQSPELSDKL